VTSVSSFGALTSSGAAVLAFDTSTREGAVAIARGGTIRSEVKLEEGLKHASGLVPAIDRALSEAGVGRTELGGVIVGAGPGSFTGVRIAAATAKGLVAGLGVPLFAVSSLAAAAGTVPGDGDRLALFDARSGRIYGAGYHVESGAVGVVVEPFAGTIEEVVERGSLGGQVAVGDGAVRHRGALEAAGARVDDDHARPSLAVGLLRHASGVAELRAVEDASSWEPWYLRPWAAGAA